MKSSRLLVLAVFSLAISSWGQSDPILVTNTNDSGPGSLRAAILLGRQQAGPGGSATIEFNIPGEGPHKIAPLTPLPVIDFSCFLNGLSQPGARDPDSTNQLNMVLKIELSGENTTGDGLETTSQSARIWGLAVNRWEGAGIHVNTIFSGTNVRYCFLGTDISGTRRYVDGIDHGNDVGLKITNGGMDIMSDNVISGNRRHGVEIRFGELHSIYNCFIGTDYTGTRELPNSHSGVWLDGGHTDIIGSLIGNNHRYGIQVQEAMGGVWISNCEIFNNYPQGIFLNSAYESVIENNIVRDNRGDGIRLQWSERCRISSNRIYDNWGLGINLVQGGSQTDGVTQNDPMDLDHGANLLQNFPVLSSAVVTESGTAVEGTLNSSPSTPFAVELYASLQPDDSGFGEGTMPLRSMEVVTDNEGNATFQAAFEDVMGDSTHFSALATDPNGNTSEFSRAMPVDFRVTNYTDIGVSVALDGDIVFTNSPFAMELTVSAAIEGSVETNEFIFPNLSVSLPPAFVLTSVHPPANTMGTNRIQFSDMAIAWGSETNVTLEGYLTEVNIHDFHISVEDGGHINSNNEVNQRMYAIAEAQWPQAVGIAMLQSNEVAEATLSGWRHTYELVVTNMNFFPIRNVVVTNDLPDSSSFGPKLISATGNPVHSDDQLIYHIDEIPGGEARRFQITVGPRSPGFMINGARVDLPGQEAGYLSINPEFNVALEGNYSEATTEAVATVPISDVAIAISNGLDHASLGQQIEFQLQVSNNSYTDLQLAYLTNYFSPNLKIVSATLDGTAGMTNRFTTNREILWPIEVLSLDSGQVRQGTIIARVVAPGPAWVSGSIFGNGLDVCPEDNTAMADLLVFNSPSVESEPSLFPGSGLFVQTVAYTNFTGTTLEGIRVTITGLPDDVRVHNATGSTNGISHVEHRHALLPGESVSLTIEFYRATREVFATPDYTIGPIGDPPPSVSGSVFAIDRQLAISPGLFLIEFAASPGESYLIQYSQDMQTWVDAWPPVTASANRVQWFDSGPPRTERPPNEEINRFYRVIDLEE